MYRFRNLILVTGLLFFFQILHSQVTDDNLNLAIKRSSGERKLELLFELANLHIDTEEMFEVTKRVEQEALEQNNMRYLAGSYALKARYFGVIENNVDSTIFYSELSIQTYDEHNIDNPGDSFLWAGTAYLRQEYYELAIYNIKKYMESSSSKSYPYVSYSLLAEAYMETERYDLAKESILQTINYFKQEKESISPHTELMGYLQLGMINMASGEYEEALEVCAVMEEIFERKQVELQDFFLVLYAYEIYNLYANLYLKINDLKRAKVYLDKTQQVVENDQTNLLKNGAKVTLGEYNLLIGNYNKALIYFEDALDYFEGEGNRQDIARDIVELKIKALRALKRSEEAFVLQQELSHYRDSIYQVNLPLQLFQLSKHYEIEKIRLEREKDKANLEKSRTINLGLIIVTALFFIILCLVKYSAKKLKDKNKILYKQFQEVDKHLYPIVVSEQKESNIEESLFDKIEAYMKEHQVYRQSNLTREDLAEMLNTNRAYLTDAIKAETGKTFFEYVNEYRLNYARFKLMEDKSVPVIQIMYDCGFSSKSPFYRLFKEKFGMSPNELREVKIELEEI